MGGEFSPTFVYSNSYDWVRRVQDKSEEEQDYNHRALSTSIGIEHLLHPNSIILIGGSFQSADEGESGAWRNLFEIGYGIRTARWLDVISLRPVVNVGYGVGTYFSEAGLNPESADGPDINVKGELQLLLDHRWPSGLGVEVGLGTHLRFSNIGYFEHGFGGRLGLSFTPDTVKADPCYTGLAHVLWDYNQEVQKLYPLYAKAVELNSENQRYEYAIEELIKDRKDIHGEVKSYCPKKIPDYKFSKRRDFIPSLPVLEDRDSCPAKRNQAEIKLGDAIQLGEKDGEYDVLNQSLSDRNDELKKTLDDLLNWAPLGCLPFPYPPKYILYSNDNPDLPLQPQWRPSVEEGALRLFSNPHLDEVMAYLDKNPDKKVHLIAIANDTSDVKADPNRDLRIAQARLDGAVQYLTLKDRTDCKEFTLAKANKEKKIPESKGLYCPYQYQNDEVKNPSHIKKKSKSDYFEKGFERVRKSGKKDHVTKKHKYIGGAILHPDEQNHLDSSREEVKTVVLPQDRVCSSKAYAAKDLFDQEGNLLPDHKKRFPTWTWTLGPKSPVFRTVLIEIVDECPDASLMEGASQIIEPQIEVSK